MDPDKNLEELRKAIENCDQESTQQLFRDLDEWISKGGFLPKDWDNKTRRPPILSTSRFTLSPCYRTMPRAR